MSQLSRRQLLSATGAAALGLALAGCGSSGGSGKDDGKDLSGNKAAAMKKFGVGDQFKATAPVDFTLLYNNHPAYPLKKNWLFWSELKKRTNATFDLTAVPMSDYEKKRSLLVGAGDAPLIIPKTYPGQESPFVSSGAILPVSDYTDLMPNFRDKVAKWKLEGDLDTLRQADGKYYVLPGLHEAIWIDYTLAARTDVLEKQGLKTPTTWDELHTVLTALKKVTPAGSYPLSDRFAPASSLLSIVAQSYGTKAGWGYSNTTWDAGASKFVFTGATDQYKQMLQYLNSLVKEGLLDPESFTQSDDDAVKKFTTGKSFFISANAQNIVNDYRSALTKTDPKATVAKIPVPIGPAGAVNSGSRLENGIMISSKAKKNKNFVAMMQLIDWLWYSDAGLEFAKWGVEGVTYTKQDGKYRLAPDVDFVGLNPKASKHLQIDFGFSNGVFAYGGSTALLQSTFSAEELAFQKVMNARKALPVDPAHPLSSDEQEQSTLWDTALKDHVTQNTLKFILGKRSFGDWNAYLAELKAKNMNQYVDQANKAYQRFKKSHT